jgi:hypothetical protein
MKVKILKHTFHNGPLKPGDVIDLQDNIANRFFGRGIAEPHLGTQDAVHSFVSTSEDDPIVPTPEQEASTLESMTAKELFDYVKQNNIRYDGQSLKGKSDEQRKEYLLTLV